MWARAIWCRLTPSRIGTAHLSPRARDQAMRRKVNIRRSENWGVAGSVRSASSGAAPRSAGGSRCLSAHRASHRRTHARRTPRFRPNEPAPPVTRSGTGSAVWALRTHEVEWSAVTATTVRLGSTRGQQLAEERAVDVSAMTSRLSSRAAVVGRHVRTLDVDVERVEAPERLGGQRGPGRVLLAPRAGRRGVHGRHAQDHARSPARRASRRSTPTTDRTARAIGCSAGRGRRRRASGSGSRAAAPRRARRALTSEASRIRAAPSTKRVRRARRRVGPPRSPRAARPGHRGSRTSRAPRRACPPCGTRGRCSTPRPRARPSSARITRAPRCSTVARSSKRGARQRELLVHLVGERVRVLARSRSRPTRRSTISPSSCVAKFTR